VVSETSPTPQLTPTALAPEDGCRIVGPRPELLQQDLAGRAPRNLHGTVSLVHYAASLPV